MYLNPCFCRKLRSMAYTGIQWLYGTKVGYGAVSRIDTLCLCGTGKRIKAQSVVPSNPLSGGLGYRLVDQQNGDVVFDRINASARRAFQALSILFHRQRLLAGRTDQNFQEFLGDHASYFTPVARVGLRNLPPSTPMMQSTGIMSRNLEALRLASFLPAQRALRSRRLRGSLLPRLEAQRQFSSCISTNLASEFDAARSQRPNYCAVTS